MLRLRETEEVLVSYLPLCHISGQILDIYIPIYTAAAVYFAQRDALKVRKNKNLIHSASDPEK